MTVQQLAELCGSEKRAGVFAGHLTDAMAQYSINTKQREAAFLAQILHESGGLRWTRELASGKAYEGRKDLGNIFDGDGPRFKGRGLIMITGRYNYLDCSKALFGDDRLLSTPELLTTPQYASLSGAWWWQSHGLNELADRGEFRHITKVINGGYNGEAEREAYYKKALRILN